VRKKKNLQTCDHVTFALTMIDYLISNADDPIIKMISVIYRSKMTLEKLHMSFLKISTFQFRKYPHFIFEKLHISFLEISTFEKNSTFDLEIELSEIVRSVRSNVQWTKDRDPVRTLFENLLSHQIASSSLNRYWTASSKGH